ncbi:lipase family protein [uncultured Williamsia sp.]|uniref:lipase family protein n=1 Tax=uncultured Williamsia sp. TaxID=259311 RepID=UPI0026160B66|nr:lipase family protein [uncultured Williamsia sp.]
MRVTRHIAVGVLAVAAVATALAAPTASAADPFYAASPSTVAAAAPGAVLKTRTIPYHVLGVATPVTAIQILYRSTDSVGAPVANVTSVLIPPRPLPTTKVVSYQSAYDSLNPADSPSRAIAADDRLGGLTAGGNPAIGGVAANGEGAIVGPMLAAGYTVVIPDTEGPKANFAAGPEYGVHTLNSLRAVRDVPATRITGTSPVGLIGYSGGAIATNWAAIEAPRYAPDVDRQLIGAAQGGLLVNPATNLRYISGTPVWSGVAGMAVVGIGRAYDIDFGPYINDFGRRILGRLADASILNVLGQYGRLTWPQVVQPKYRNPNSVRAFVDATNKVNMGAAGTPSIPMFVAQGANGALEGTPTGPAGVGTGDGVMVAGDVRTLMRDYCAAGLRIQYDEYPALSHTLSAVPWLAGALQWLTDRFADRPAPSNCAAIRPGNSLAPQVYEPAP